MVMLTAVREILQQHLAKEAYLCSQVLDVLAIKGGKGVDGFRMASSLCIQIAS